MTVETPPNKQFSWLADIEAQRAQSMEKLFDTTELQQALHAFVYYDLNKDRPKDQELKNAIEMELAKQVLSYGMGKSAFAMKMTPERIAAIAQTALQEGTDQGLVGKDKTTLYYWAQDKFKGVSIPLVQVTVGGKSI